MNIYETYCQETLDGASRLTNIQIHYLPNFNFGYDVVDATVDLEATGLCCPRFTVQQKISGFVNLTEALTSAPEELPRQETAAHAPCSSTLPPTPPDTPRGFHDFTSPFAHSVTAKYRQQAENNGLHFTVVETGWALMKWKMC